jgi:predicted small lipoprotein YifL
MRPATRPLVLLAGAALLAMLGGCGQKGPLYLPEKNPAVITPPAAPPAPAPAQAQAPTETPPPQAAPDQPPPDKKQDDDSQAPQ